MSFNLANVMTSIGGGGGDVPLGGDLTGAPQSQLDSIINNPQAAPWDYSMAIYKKYGEQGLAQLQNNGYLAQRFPQWWSEGAKAPYGDEALGKFVAARESETAHQDDIMGIHGLTPQSLLQVGGLALGAYGLGSGLGLLGAGEAGAGLSGLSAADAAALGDSYGAVSGAGAAAAGAGASVPIDWNSATAGGVSDTGFGAGTVPQGGQVFDFLDNVDWGGAGEAGQFSAPGVGDAGAFDQFGSLVGPGSDTTIFGGTSANPFGSSGLADWFKDPKNIQTVLKALGVNTPGAAGGTGTGTGTGGGAPGMDIFSAMLGFLGNKNYANTLQQMQQKAIDSDLWRGEQPKYFPLAYDAASKGIGNTAYGQSIADASARKMASMGYNLSGNQMTDLGQSLNSGTVNYLNAIQPFATGRPGPAGVIAQTGGDIANANRNQIGAVGYGLEDIYKKLFQTPTAQSAPNPNAGSGNYTWV